MPAAVLGSAKQIFFDGRYLLPNKLDQLILAVVWQSFQPVLFDCSELLPAVPTTNAAVAYLPAASNEIRVRALHHGAI